MLVGMIINFEGYSKMCIGGIWKLHGTLEFKKKKIRTVYSCYIGGTHANVNSSLLPYRGSAEMKSVFC